MLLFSGFWSLFKYLRVPHLTPSSTAITTASPPCIYPFCILEEQETLYFFIFVKNAIIINLFQLS